LILIGETEAANEPACGAATLRQALNALDALAAAGGDPFRYRLLRTETLTWLGDAETRQGNAVVALKHRRALWRLADCSLRFGQVYEALAERAKLPNDQRTARQQVRDWYQKKSSALG
jgi:hypothetical protein